MTSFSKRLSHIVTRADLATLLCPTYATALNVDDEDAHERLTRALESAELQNELYESLELALHEAQGPRTDGDALLDKLSKSVQARRGRVKPAAATPALSAVLVRVNLEIGLAPETLWNTLSSEKGRAMYDAGLHALAVHLVKELLRQ